MLNIPQLHLILLSDQNRCKYCGKATTYIKEIKEPFVNNYAEYKRLIDRTKFVSCVSLIKIEEFKQ